MLYIGSTSTPFPALQECKTERKKACTQGVRSGLLPPPLHGFAKSGIYWRRYSLFHDTFRVMQQASLSRRAARSFLSKSYLPTAANPTAKRRQKLQSQHTKK